MLLCANLDLGTGAMGTGTGGSKAPGPRCDRGGLLPLAYGVLLLLAALELVGWMMLSRMACLNPRKEMTYFGNFYFLNY